MPQSTGSTSSPVSATSNTAVAELVLNRASILAHEMNQPPVADQQIFYPDDELEWLATTAFNQAVDSYLASRDQDSQRWGQKAIELSELMRDDKGALTRLLKDNFAKLWREGGIC
jgi:hypothetical protein